MMGEERKVRTFLSNVSSSFDIFHLSWGKGGREHLSHARAGEPHGQHHLLGVGQGEGCDEMLSKKATAVCQIHTIHTIP